MTMTQEISHKRLAVLFDLDGVLIDSEGIYSNFWNAINELYPTHVENFSNKIKGSSLTRILSTYFPDNKAQIDIINRLNNLQRTMPYNLFPGAIDFIDSLTRHGIPKCIVTSSSSQKMADLYAQHPSFKQRFEKVVTGDMVSQPKPNPECFLLGAKLLGVDIANCFVFEDSLNGLQAAHASGAHVVGVATTNKIETIKPYSNSVINTIAEANVNDLINFAK